MTKHEQSGVLRCTRAREHRGPAGETDKDQVQQTQRHGSAILPVTDLAVWQTSRSVVMPDFETPQVLMDTDRKLRNHIRQIQAPGFDVTLTKPA